MAHLTPEMWGKMAEQSVDAWKKQYLLNEYRPDTPPQVIKFRRYSPQDPPVNINDIFEQSVFNKADVDKLVAEAVAWHAAEIATLREALLDRGDGQLDVLDWEELIDDEQ